VHVVWGDDKAIVGVVDRMCAAEKLLLRFKEVGFALGRGKGNARQ
jgi:hypothetical protein